MSPAISVGMSVNYTRYFRPAILLAVWLVFMRATPAAAQTNAQAQANASPDVSAWMSQASGTGTVDAPARTGTYGTLRSMAALLVVLGGLFGVHVFLRRRVVHWTSPATNSLRVVARKRFGVRQELVVVEWEGQRLLLGAGPGFITRLGRIVSTACQPEAEAQK
jgi:flagellar biogenesis protein FliO